MVGGYFIEKHFNNYRNRKGSSAKIEFISAFSTTNFVRSLRSIHILLDNVISFDSFHLIRSLYENYLTIKYLYCFPSEYEIFDAQLGILTGSHELARTKTGTGVQNQIVELATGRVITIPSRWAMASRLGEFDRCIYNDLYRRLSSYTHSEIANFRYFISDQGFDYLNPNFEADVLIITHVICALFFYELKRNSTSAMYLKRDLSINVERSVFAICAFRAALAHEGKADGFPKSLELALLTLARKDERVGRVYDAVGELYGPAS